MNRKEHSVRPQDQHESNRFHLGDQDYGMVDPGDSVQISSSGVKVDGEHRGDLAAGH